ncbi:MAG: hypothetical protein R3F59_26470 [Myxococcota bacterium]
MGKVTDQLKDLPGYIASCVVDSDSGMTLEADAAGRLNIEMAAAGNTEVVKAKRKTMKMLGLKDEIEDILITLGQQYHVIRPLPGTSPVFVYVAVDRNVGNLALTRMRVAEVSRSLV